MSDRPVGSLDLLRTAYGDLSALVSQLSEAEAARPSGCLGWAVLDLVQHLLFDTRRALVGLATPADAPADTDAVGYWRAWQPSAAEAADDLWRTRVVASVAGGITTLAESYAEATAAVLVAAARADEAGCLRTQGHVLTAGDLFSTLAVEACVHHLDVVVELDRPGPAAGPLGEVRRVLEALLGRELPAGWDDVTAARRGTGRQPLTGDDVADLGELADRFPLFG